MGILFMMIKKSLIRWMLIWGLGLEQKEEEDRMGINKMKIFKKKMMMRIKIFRKNKINYNKLMRRNSMILKAMLIIKVVNKISMIKVKINPKSQKNLINLINLINHQVNQIIINHH